MKIPPDFTLTHMTVNTGHLHKREVFRDQSPQAIANIVQFFEPLFEKGEAPVPGCAGLHARLIDASEYGPDCAWWAIASENEQEGSWMTCCASLTPNAALFAEAMTLARTQLGVFTDYMAKNTDAETDVDAAFLTPPPVISMPPPAWLATVLHVPLFMADPDDILMLADMNQCLAATALHRQDAFTYYRR